jgi:hypothetical protein
VPLAPTAKLNFVKPLSCFGGLVGAVDGRPIYNCGTSAAVTEPLFVMTQVIVATISNKPACPPGTIFVLPAAVLSDEIVSPE